MPAEPCQNCSQAEFEQRIDPLRPRLIAFAKSHLKFEADAEDAVQECLISAWKRLEKFEGKSSLETWVFGILRHKLIDLYRRHSKIQTFEYDESKLPDTDGWFQKDEHWHNEHAPSSWSSPYQTLENEHFWQVFDICVFHLPEQTSRVFTLREFMGFETSQICESLQITEHNCWTILHRARLRLRACLEQNWFTAQEKPL
ncbi:sigma-70 family RNA polymerase sigma factor [Thiomicrorhabdus xiamenensis]|uniref:Sigma-70 family RNA polymerase sigma factor n=1 Tax=Thiomicrorhabdus xiamenensis TaxID=2739063 RepID=A0A7D4T178_9GAMM|nr:sigma-70 family RNA polymerase sigma factor [Thiomicrorhabdus xiamenensis]QKI89385.1 sigma-70 family RNA polymerase sigma factor [Thiomicrorhabdus xiamenensis]